MLSCHTPISSTVIELTTDCIRVQSADLKATQLWGVIIWTQNCDLALDYKLVVTVLYRYFIVIVHIQVAYSIFLILLLFPLVNWFAGFILNWDLNFNATDFSRHHFHFYSIPLLFSAFKFHPLCYYIGLVLTQYDSWFLLPFILRASDLVIAALIHLIIDFAVKATVASMHTGWKLALKLAFVWSNRWALCCADCYLLINEALAMMILYWLSMIGG